MARASIKDLGRGDREQNAEIIRAVLGGEPGPRRDIVLMTPPPRSWPARGRATSRTGWVPPPRSRSTRGGRAASSTPWSR